MRLSITSLVFAAVAAVAQAQPTATVVFGLKGTSSGPIPTISGLVKGLPSTSGNVLFEFQRKDAYGVWVINPPNISNTNIAGKQVPPKPGETTLTFQSDPNLPPIVQANGVTYRTVVRYEYKTADPNSPSGYKVVKASAESEGSSGPPSP